MTQEFTSIPEGCGIIKSIKELGYDETEVRQVFADPNADDKAIQTRLTELGFDSLSVVELAMIAEKPEKAPKDCLECGDKGEGCAIGSFAIRTVGDS